MQNRFDDLPNEVLIEIVNNLDRDDASKAAQAAPFLHFIITDIWQRRCDRHFPGAVADDEREFIEDWVEYFTQIESMKYEHLLPKLRPLFYYAKERQFAPIMREPLQINNLLATDTQKNSLLSLCMKSKHQGVLNYFYNIAVAFFTTDNNIDLEKVDNDGNSLLHWAVYCRQSADTIHALLDYGFNINQISTNGKTPLMIAAEHSIDHVSLLLNLDADMSVINNAGKDAFLVAVENDNPEIVERLIQYGANLKQFTQGEVTREKPLIVAARLGRLRSLHVLAKHENIDYRDLFTGETLLHIAVKNNQIKTVKYLITQHADVNATDFTGATPLHFAMRYGSDDIAIELMDNGANLNAAMNNQTKPLYMAVNYNRTAIVSELLKRHADIKQAEQNNLGVNMLYIAAMNGGEDIVKVLLKHGVDVNSTRKERKSALYIATKHGYSSVVKFLLEHCADPNISDTNGLTPLHIAARSGHLDIIKLLLKFHAIPNKRTASANKTACMLAEEHQCIEAANLIHKHIAGTYRYLKRKLPTAEPQIDISQAFNESAVYVDVIPPSQLQRNTFWRRAQPAPQPYIPREDENSYIIDL